MMIFAMQDGQPPQQLRLVRDLILPRSYGSPADGVDGDGLRSRKDERRTTEVDVAVHALNRMLELGRPISVRIA